MEITKLWPLAEAVIRYLGDQYEPAVRQVAKQFALEITSVYGWLLVAKVFEPEPISVDRLRIRSPYSAPRLYAERLANAAARGFLHPVGRDGYVLTEKGSLVEVAVVQVIYARLAQMSPLPVESLNRLASLLWKLVEASLAAPEPLAQPTWCLAHSRKMDPGPVSAVMVHIDQYLSDLAAYRDDAHLSSWQPLGIDGPTWDALTCLWHASPLSLDELFEKLNRRGWDKGDYATRLCELIQKGWVEQIGETYSILTPGRDARQEAEDLTDERFYCPWRCLSVAELEELQGLLAGINAD